jgi:hypothetical protein
MEAEHFDSLTRKLAAPSRRRLLALLVGSPLAGTVAVWPWQETAARCRKPRRCPQPIGCCPRGTRCLHGACFSRSICPDKANCADSIQCHSSQLNVCFCGVTKEGRPICYLEYTICEAPIPCNKSSDCDPGRVCLRVAPTCCFSGTVTGTCVEPCSSPAPA